MKFNFNRIITKGKYLPEIDGLRFLAIVSVVVYHLSIFIIEKDVNSYNKSYDLSFLKKVI